MALFLLSGNIVVVVVVVVVVVFVLVVMLAEVVVLEVVEVVMEVEVESAGRTVSETDKGVWRDGPKMVVGMGSATPDPAITSSPF
ncbi:hypothetical protein E2C01_099787 [Portunus trituberculatus]|uniref:Uncharacterized protein n=1 Tax=Portunus trituberculatus TaxID=210409 RepID=A0A5B7KHQ5_PORTR|nr:hypothetical protein [Portunus trituberculatus]